MRRGLERTRHADAAEAVPRACAYNVRQKRHVVCRVVSCVCVHQQRTYIRCLRLNYTEYVGVVTSTLARAHAGVTFISCSFFGLCCVCVLPSVYRN